MNFKDFIYPELIFLIPFLNLTGWWIKHKTSIKNTFIPLILGAFGICLSTLYIYTSMNQGFADSLAEGILQGIFLSSTAVYANQLTKTFDEANEE